MTFLTASATNGFAIVSYLYIIFLVMGQNLKFKKMKKVRMVILN